RPETAGHVAAYLERRLGRSTDAEADRETLLPLAGGLLTGGPEPVRTALAAVLGAPGALACASLRAELRDILLDHEDDPAVLDALLRAAVLPSRGPGEEPSDRGRGDEPDEERGDRPGEERGLGPGEERGRGPVEGHGCGPGREPADGL
ncbi:hypothetical protein NGM37_31865, partial [Streptomyces sp. TRM76130]|nr:hypothetical protein [Streptomyces sp. TRM76130]